MSRFERQVSWLPTVAPTAELDSAPLEQNLTFDFIWQPKSSVLPTLPETPPAFVEDYQPQINIDSIIDQRNLSSLLSTPPPPLPTPCQ